MHIHNISETPSILNLFLAEIRDVSIQKDQMRFRRNIERIGEILGLELSKTLTFSNRTTQTPLGQKETLIHENGIVLCSILRAGIPLHQGLLNYFDGVENAFISAYRKHNKNSDSFDIAIDYLASPNLNGKTLILADPMLATGQSMVAAYEALKPYGVPNKVHLLSVIGSKAGVEFVNRSFGLDTHLWIADIDDHLNEKGYIVPGLGDAGDLAFGTKL